MVTFVLDVISIDLLVGRLRGCLSSLSKSQGNKVRILRGTGCDWEELGQQRGAEPGLRKSDESRCFGGGANIPLCVMTAVSQTV